MHGLTSCIGQLSRPSALFVATIAAIISFETSGESLPGAGAPALAAVKAATNTIVVVICARSKTWEPPILPSNERDLDED